MHGVGVVGGVCEMCLARVGVGGEGSEWMTGLGLGFTNPVEREGVVDLCMWLGCGDVGGRVWKGGVVCCYCYIYVSCESGLFVTMSRYLYIVLGGYLHILGALVVPS